MAPLLGALGFADPGVTIPLLCLAAAQPHEGLRFHGS